MIFVIDIGNTNIVLGVYKDSKLIQHWRMATDRNKSEEEYGMFLKQLMDYRKISFLEIEGVVISSVVPSLTGTLENMIRKYFNKEPLVIGPGIKTGIKINIENPKELGADRIVNALAGIEIYGTPLIIVDFGTATTIDYIDEEGIYQGGAIAPGISISTEALYQRAAKLPRVDIVKPDSVVGKSTISAMQAGIIYGFVGQVDAITEKMIEQSKETPKVVATGGLAKLIVSESKMIDEVNSLLTLEGLIRIYQRNLNRRN